MSKLTDLITAMREAGGREGRGSAAWLELAQTDEKLGAAIHALFGKRMPTPQKLGLWLNSNSGAKAGEFTLLGKHSTHAKAWVYAVRSAADVAADAAEDARRETERQAERDRIVAEDMARVEKSALVAAKTETYNHELRERMAARREKGHSDGFIIVAGNVKREVKAAAAEVAAEPAPALDPMHSPPPVSENYLYTTRTNSDGKVSREYVRDRQGNPLPAPGHFSPIAGASKPEAPKPAPVVEKAPGVVPRTNVPAHLLPIWTQEGRQPTRKELAAAHRSPAGGAWISDGPGEAARFVPHAEEGESWQSLRDRGSGVGEHVAGSGVRVPYNDDAHDAWRAGGPNWTKRL